MSTLKDNVTFDSDQYRVGQFSWTHDVVPGSYTSASIDIDINVFTYNDWGVLDLFVSDDPNFDYGNSYIAMGKPEFVGRLSISGGPPTGSFQTVSYDLKSNQLPWLDDGNIHVALIGPFNTFPGWPAQFRLLESTLAADGAATAPTAVDDEFEVIENLTLTVAGPGVLANDTDPDGDALAATVLDGPAHGALTLDADGGFTYEPDPGFFGRDQFTYRVDDGFGGTDAATVTLEVLRDQDGDGVPDIRDNAILVYNPDQRDTDGDGYGNVADADLNNDGIVDSLDIGIFKQRFLTSDPDADFNGDDIVDSIDLGLMKQMFLKPPGPSYVDFIDDDSTMQAEVFAVSRQQGGSQALDGDLFSERFLTDDPAADLNGDGIVDSIDLGLMKQMFANPPEPSSLDPLAELSNTPDHGYEPGDQLLLV